MSNTVIAPLIFSYSVDDDVLTLDGTAVADSTVTIFDGTTSIGTSRVNADGAWDVTTGALANGTYSITATDVDAAENISPASSALTITVNTTPIPVTYFGMTIQSFDYNYGYGVPAEAWPSIPISVARSWLVWSPGNGKIEYLDWSDLNPSAGVYDWTALNAWIAANQANHTQMVYTFGSVPSWAGEAATPNLTDFQAFVTAIVTQADGAIKYWEGFNEFNVTGIAPATVVQLQEIIYNTVHTYAPVR